MRSLKPSFKFLNRGFKETLVLIPGWATDYRIFSGLELDYDYLIPVDFSVDNFKRILLDKLDKLKIKDASLFGWSQGGFLASEFAKENPERIKEVILLNIRREFNPTVLAEIRSKLKKNKKAFLYKFYQDCFSAQDRTGWEWFKKNLLKKYINEMELENLLDGLDYLSRCRIEAGSLSAIKKMKIFHGSEDKIAPPQEALEIQSELPQAKFILLTGIGHVSFLNGKFKAEFKHG